MYAFFYIIVALIVRRLSNTSLICLLTLAYFTFSKTYWNISDAFAGGPFTALIYKVNKVDFNLIFILLIVISSSSWKANKSNSMWPIFFLIITFFSFNQLSDTYNVLEINLVDLQLLNGIMSVHPLVLLITYALAIKTSYIIFKESNTFHASDTHCSKLIKYSVFKKRSLITVLLFNLFSLVLGSYWALQELNWGGYWSWDPVEAYSLCILVLLYTYSHLSNYSIKPYLSLSKFLLMLTMFITIRIGFLDSVHSFILSSSADLSLSLGTTLLSIIFLCFLILAVLSRLPPLLKSPEIFLIKLMLTLAHSLAMIILLYGAFTALFSIYSKSFLVLNQNTVVFFITLLVVCGYVNTYNLPILLLNMLDSLLLNYFFFHFNKRPPLSMRHTLGLLTLVLLFNQSKHSLIPLQPIFSDTLTLFNLKTNNFMLTSADYYIPVIYELGSAPYKELTSLLFNDNFLPTSDLTQNHTLLNSLVDLGLSEVFVSKETSVNNISFFKPIVILISVYFSLTLMKRHYWFFFRPWRF